LFREQEFRPAQATTNQKVRHNNAAEGVHSFANYSNFAVPFTKEQSMRNSLSKKPELEEGQQTIFFQIANGNARQSMQPEDQISNPAPGFSLSPSKLEQDRANGAGLSGKGMF
jgi:hypothetical protein